MMNLFEKEKLTHQLYLVKILEDLFLHKGGLEFVINKIAKCVGYYSLSKLSIDMSTLYYYS